MATRLGALTFQVPQVRGNIDFYPSALEKGLRSERALKLALAEMYVKGISTRKVTDVLEAMCGPLTLPSHLLGEGMMRARWLSAELLEGCSSDGALRFCGGALIGRDKGGWGMSNYRCKPR